MTQLMPLATAQDGDLATAAVLGVRALLQLVGEDPDRPGLEDTPYRVIKAFMEMCERPGDPAEFMTRMFADAEAPVDQVIAVGPIAFTSVCEHHLLPFSGHAFIAYIPDADVIGLSKIPRLLEHYARRPQVQERLTTQVGATLGRYVPNKGVAVTITADHSCASMRGVKRSAPMTTSYLTGAFRNDPATRSEFFDLTRGARNGSS